MDAKTFRNLPTPEVAQIVRDAGPKVCVFPINGTRRWFMLEHPPGEDEDPMAAYLAVSEQRHIELYRMIFDQGIDTLLTPIFGPDLLERGEAYVQMAADGLARIATAPEFLDFYRAYDVRVRFYGDHRKHLGPTPHAGLSDLFDSLTEQTKHHSRHRLFFGVFAHDAAETVAELGIRYHAERGKAPDKQTIVELYYGEYVPPVDIFIGFDKLCAFDMPLIATGNEDLYFTISPSPYLTETQLRDILHDHLYRRRDAEPDYAAMTEEDRALMRALYHANLGNTLGLGGVEKRWGYWYPLPQVQLPDALVEKPQQAREDL